MTRQTKTGTDRPDFLATRPVGETGADLIAAFRLAKAEDAKETDRWLLVNSVYGSLTWQEQALFRFIEDQD